MEVIKKFGEKKKKDIPSQDIHSGIKVWNTGLSFMCV